MITFRSTQINNTKFGENVHKYLTCLINLRNYEATLSLHLSSFDFLAASNPWEKYKFDKLKPFLLEKYAEFSWKVGSHKKMMFTNIFAKK